MIRYLGTEDTMIDPAGAIADWKANNVNFTHVGNESHLKMVEETGMGHEVTTNEKQMMKFFHDPEFVTKIHP